MKIIQIMPEFGLAGAETMCENLIYELKKLGHKVVVISMYDYHSPITERLEHTGVCVRYLGKKKGFDYRMIKKMVQIFKEEKPDIVHTHRYAIEYGIPAAILAGVKGRIHTVHNIAEKENGSLVRKLNNVLFRLFHTVPVALSELIKDSIVSEYGIKEKNIPVVLNGIDLSKCIPKETYDIEGNFKILHIGRFSEQKNHKGLLDAFYSFHSKYPQSELWLIGDGEKQEEVKLFVENNRLNECVKFLGLQNDVYSFLNKADMFVLPSNYEGIPMTLIEAMGTGLPIVATIVGGIPDMLDEKSAILIPVDDNATSEAFEKYYCDENLRMSHGKKALKLSDRFSAETMAKRYCNIYEK